jgi:cyanophycinase
MITLAAGITGLALLMDHASLPVLMILAVVTGLSFPALTGAWTAQLATLVSPEQLPRAYSADAGTYSVAAILGPPAAAAVLVLSTTARLWLPFALLIIAIGLLQLVPLTPRVRTAEHSLVSDLRHGVAIIVRRAALRRTVLITTIAFAGQAALFISAPILAQRLTGSLAFTGVIFAFLAAGGIVAAGFVLRFPIRHPDLIVVVTTVISGLALALVAIAGNVTLVIIGVFIIGLTEAPQLTAMFLIRNRESPVRVRSQVFTTSSSLRATAFALGAALFGTLLPRGTTCAYLSAATLLRWRNDPYAGAMTAGRIALVGSGEYLPVMQDIEAWLLEDRPPRYVQIATAAAPEGPASLKRWHDLGAQAADRLGVEQVIVDIRKRPDADDLAWIEAITGAGLIYLSGGNPSFLARTLSGSKVWAAIEREWRGGASIAGCSAGAMALAGYVPDFRHPRGGGVDGLGLVPDIRVLPHFDRYTKWMPDFAMRPLVTPSAQIIGIDEDTAFIGEPSDTPDWSFTSRGRQSVWRVEADRRYRVNSPMELRVNC